MLSHNSHTEYKLSLLGLQFFTAGEHMSWVMKKDLCKTDQVTCQTSHHNNALHQQDALKSPNTAHNNDEQDHG